MTQKYQKPYARSLGDILPDAQGYCVSGSIADTQMPQSGNSCFPGQTASGAGCGFGGIPDSVACYTGKQQQYFGCGEGFRASGGPGYCTVGTEA